MIDRLRFHETESNRLCAVSTLLDTKFKRLHFRDSTAVTKAVIEVDQSTRSSSEEHSRKQQLK
ncbi:hypothetical protein J437_LFUL017781 [Ladona fulva]|uniref:Uncharacterized protein n=1 Tax=Ladona fulva TaxID=123851 RepID=A0A8K0KMA8_LADFU|nr:hypothetical protein J437_LFUL017781 [Ladona fulva]